MEFLITKEMIKNKKVLVKKTNQFAKDFIEVFEPNLTVEDEDRFNLKDMIGFDKDVQELNMNNDTKVKMIDRVRVQLMRRIQVELLYNNGEDTSLPIEDVEMIVVGLWNNLRFPHVTISPTPLELNTTMYIVEQLKSPLRIDKMNDSYNLNDILRSNR